MVIDHQSIEKNFLNEKINTFQGQIQHLESYYNFQTTNSKQEIKSSIFSDLEDQVSISVIKEWNEMVSYKGPIEKFIMPKESVFLKLSEKKTRIEMFFEMMQNNNTNSNDQNNMSNFPTDANGNFYYNLFL